MIRSFFIHCSFNKSSLSKKRDRLFFNVWQKHATLTLTNPMCWTNGVSTMSNKTIKELADELNVSKTAINKKLNANLKRKHFSKIANKFVIDEEGQNIIKSMFQEVKSTTKNDNHQQENSETENLKVVDFFHEQIVIKDEQLKEKDKQIEKLQSLLDQQQILTLQANKKIETLEYNSEKKEEEKPTKNNEKRNWFSRVFK